MSSACAYPCATDNHSDELVTVYHGCPQPVTLCGFHSTWSLTRVMDAVRDAGEHDCRANFVALAAQASPDHPSTH